MHLVAIVNLTLWGKGFVCLACRSQKPSRAMSHQPKQNGYRGLSKALTLLLCSLNQRTLGYVFDRAYFYKKNDTGC